MATNGKSEDRVMMTAQELRDRSRQLRKQADEVKADVVKQLNIAAQTLRTEAKKLDLGDVNVKDTVDDLAKGLEKAASYVNSRSVEEIGADATHVVRQNPWRVVGVIFFVGLLVGLLLRGDRD